MEGKRKRIIEGKIRRRKIKVEGKDKKGKEKEKKRKEKVGGKVMITPSLPIPLTFPNPIFTPLLPSYILPFLPSLSHHLTFYPFHYSFHPLMPSHPQAYPPLQLTSSTSFPFHHHCVDPPYQTFRRSNSFFLHFLSIPLSPPISLNSLLHFTPPSRLPLTVTHAPSQRLHRPLLSISRKGGTCTSRASRVKKG